MRILVVDDDRPTRTGLSELLAEAGYDVTSADSFDDAANILRTTPPDLLITDIRLDGRNGLQLLLKSSIPVPAIVLTGFDDSVLEAHARGEGAVYMVKPVTVEQLLDQVQTMIGAGPRD